MTESRKDKYGEYGRLPDNIFETYNAGMYPATYRTTNALIFPDRLVAGEEVLSGEQLSQPTEDEEQKIQKKE
ncbi:MAG: hypothetical protein HPY66_3125 [Firmicutes bacterium]|nr:hypothetical protein [Bacillota bacterium]MDI6706171.1 hypothetical protein [Bacillota bacterium]